MGQDCPSVLLYMMPSNNNNNNIPHIRMMHALCMLYIYPCHLEGRLQSVQVVCTNDSFYIFS